MKTFSYFIAGLFFTVFSQSTISGKITDAKTGEVLVGANVYVVGSNIGAATDSDGEFSFNIDDGEYKIKASFVGYKSEEVTVNVQGKEDIIFELSEAILSEEVVVTANRAKLRETPIAFTNVGKEEIENNYVTQDVPDLIKAVPGVFVNNNGLGESEILIRGFDPEHIQIMINGIPVNDPESQVTYWSNWSGLSSGAKDIQIQRGVGSSLYGSGSFGGSVNIQHTDFSPEREILYYNSGESYSQEADRIARNGVFGLKYTTGLMGDWNFTASYERKIGDSYTKGTYYDGHSFALGAQYIKDDHKLTFNFVGAPQEHNQARTMQDLALLKTLGREYNRNNHPYQKNYYFKPQFEVHHEYFINKKTTLNTNAFVSIGRGGGQYLRNDNFDVNTGSVSFKNVSDATDRRYFGRHARYVYEATNGAVTLSGYNPVAQTYTYRGLTENVTRSRNLPNSDFAHSWRNDSHSEHEQIGLNMFYKTEINQMLTLTTGGEFRHWVGAHFADTELFRKSDGAGGVTTLDNVEQRYNYDGIVDNLSIFARFNVKINEQMMAMVDAQFANYSYRVEEKAIKIFDFQTESFNGNTYFATKNSGNFKDSDYERTYTFFTPKFGLNYNATEEFNVFVNYSIAKKEPKVRDWYSRSSGPRTDIDIDPETIKTLELGLGFNSTNFSVNANIYLSNFEDKIESVTNRAGDRVTINAGNAEHNGLELAAAYKMDINEASSITFRTSATFANHFWKNLDVQQIFGNSASEVTGRKVPFSPLTMINPAIGFKNDLFTANLSYRYWDSYYANYTNSVKLPVFRQVDLNIGKDFDLGSYKLELTIFANNLFDNDNIAKAAWTRDFNRNDSQAGVYQVYVQQSPLRYFGLAMRLKL